MRCWFACLNRNPRAGRLSAENLHLIVVALFGWLKREQQMSSNPAITLVPLPLYPAAHTLMN